MQQTSATINDFMQNNMVLITDLRRYPKRIFDRLPQTGPVAVMRDGRFVGIISPASTTVKSLTIDEKIALTKKSFGGFNLGKGMSPDQINRSLEARYE